MKTTIRKGSETKFTIQPVEGGVMLVKEGRHPETREWAYYCSMVFEGSEVGALMFAIEMAAEASDIARQRAAVACQHARICDQEGECVNGCTQRLGAPA